MAKILALLLVCFATFGQTLSVINTGTTSNDGTGDSLRTAFTKANTNFYQLWSEVFTNIPVDIANAGGAGKLDATNGTAVNLSGSLTNATIDGSASSYLSGITGNVQTNLDGRLPTSIGAGVAVTNLATFGNLITLAVGFTPPSSSLKVNWSDTYGAYVMNRSATNSTYTLASPGATYYLSPSGNDANAGTSSASPKKSIANLIDALNASPPAGGARIYLDAGLYSAGDSWNVKNLEFHAEFIGTNYAGGTNVIAYIPSGRGGSEFSLAGGAVYVRYGHDVVGVVTWSSRDAYGAPYKFTLDGSSYANEAAVIAGLPAGYYYELAGATYIRMLDDSAPDERTLTVSANNTSFHSIGSDNLTLYLRNIRMTGHGGGILYQSTDTQNTTMAAYNVEVAGNSNADEDLWEIIIDSGFAFTDHCRADHGLKDGFNYHQGVVRDGGWFLEYYCSATGNGSNQSSNGSTAHEEVVGIRVGGYYVHNYGRNQHDIQDAQILNIGCQAGLSILTGVDQDVGFNSAQEGLDTGSTQMWLINCTSLGGGANNRGYSASGTSTMHFIGTTGSEADANVYRATNAKIVRWGQPAGTAGHLNVGTTAGTVAAGDALAEKMDANDGVGTGSTTLESLSVSGVAQVFPTTFTLTYSGTNVTQTASSRAYYLSTLTLTNNCLLTVTSTDGASGGITIVPDSSTSYTVYLDSGIKLLGGGSSFVVTNSASETVNLEWKQTKRGGSNLILANKAVYP